MTLREIISIYGEGEEVHFSGKKYPWLFHWKDSQGHDVSLIFTYNNYTMADWYKSENYDLYSHLQDLSEEEKLDNYTVSYMYIKAPYTMQFESFDSIRHFLAASQSSDEIYNEYWTTNQDSTQIPRAQAIGYAEHLQASLCPVTDAKITCIFTADRNEMMYTIRVQNVLYKFTYQFDGWPQEYDQSKYVKNVTIDSYTFAMYASPAGLAGLTNIGNASVLFEIETLDTEAVKSDLTDTIRFVKCLETDTES